MKMCRTQDSNGKTKMKKTSGLFVIKKCLLNSKASIIVLLVDLSVFNLMEINWNVVMYVIAPNNV